MGKLDRIIMSYYGYRFPSNISILSTNKYLISGISSFSEMIITNIMEQEELSLVLELIFVLQLGTESLTDIIMRH